jgi:hypothetical protein
MNPTTTAQVFFHQSMTINLGNYEATKVDVGISLPVEDGETNSETFARAVNFVAVNLEAQIKEVLGPKPVPSTSNTPTGKKKLRRKKK